MTDFETILTSTRGRVGVVTLNRPQALNALNLTLMREVVEAVEAFDADESIGAIVVTGSERAFAAGADIKEMAAMSHGDVVARDLFAAWDRFGRVRIPILAAVSGYALGGGCELAMMCDTIFASDTAKFGQPEITLGVIPGIGGSQRLTRAIGKAKAMDLILTGRSIDAEEAERAGLVARVFPAADLVEETIAVASTIAERSRPATIAAKEAVKRAFESSLAEGLLAERRAFYGLFALEDRAEGMAAFIEKREPTFRHR
jgi:enoyl-CoA hydratase